MQYMAGFLSCNTAQNHQRIHKVVSTPLHTAPFILIITQID